MWTVRHVAGVHLAFASVVETITDGVLAAHGLSAKEPMPLSDLSGPVAEPGHLVELWDAGIPNWLVAEIFRRVAAPVPMPVGFYLGVLTHRPDLAWVSDTTSAAPPRDLHSWLAWTESEDERGSPELLGHWLALGLPIRHFDLLKETDYLPQEVASLAKLWRVSGPRAAALLCEWVQAGCQPTVGQLAQLVDAGFSPYTRINAAVIARLAAMVPTDLTTTELGLLIVVCGAVPIAAAWLRSGARDAFAAAAALDRGQQPNHRESVHA